MTVQTFPKEKKNFFYDNLWIFTIGSSKMNGGITLGQFVFLNDRMLDSFHMKHEGGGHGKQSLILGPFYLLVIGVPSLIHAALHKTGDYYHFWTEKWANKLGDVK